KYASPWWSESPARSPAAHCSVLRSLLKTVLRTFAKFFIAQLGFAEPVRRSPFRRGGTHRFHRSILPILGPRYLRRAGSVRRRMESGIRILDVAKENRSRARLARLAGMVYSTACVHRQTTPPRRR